MSSDKNAAKSSIGYVYTLLAGIFFSLTATLSRLLKNLGVPSIEQGFFRISFTALFFGSILLIKSPLRKLEKGDLKFFFINGLFGVSLSITAYLSSIALGTPLAVAVTLSYLQPMFSVILARLFLREGITPTKVVAVTTSILGAAIVSGIWQVFGATTPINMVGVALATMNGFFYSTYIIIGRFSGSNKNYHFATTMFYSFFFGLLWVIPIWLMLGALINQPVVSGFIVDLPLEAWILLSILIGLATITPYGLVSLGLRYVKASRAGILLLVEPISVMIMGALIFSEPLTAWGLVGSALILSSTVLITLEGRLHKSEISAKPKRRKIARNH